jgi:hypothetical protein
MSNLTENLIPRWTMNDLSGALGLTTVRRLYSLFFEIRSSATYRRLFREYLSKKKKFEEAYKNDSQEIILKRTMEILVALEKINEIEPSKTRKATENGDEMDRICSFLLHIIRAQRPHDDPWGEDTSPSIEAICIFAHQLFLKLFLDRISDSSEDSSSPTSPSSGTSILRSPQSKLSLSGKRTSLRPKAPHSSNSSPTQNELLDSDVLAGDWHTSDYDAESESEAIERTDGEEDDII